MNISDTIKATRRKRLFSQSYLAKEIGVSFSTVSCWENRKSVPQIIKIKLIKAFCTEHNILFDISDDFFNNAKGEK